LSWFRRVSQGVTGHNRAETPDERVQKKVRYFQKNVGCIPYIPFEIPFILSALPKKILALSLKFIYSVPTSIKSCNPNSVIWPAADRVGARFRVMVLEVTVDAPPLSTPPPPHAVPCAASTRRLGPMSDLRSRYVLSRYVVRFLALLTLAPGMAFAQGLSGDVPANARAKSYGTGWECQRGFRETDGACVAVVVPANGYGTDATYGRGWECRRGYREVDEACIAVKVPANAYLDPPGDGWKCHRGFLESDGNCIAIKVPRNGYLTDTAYGSGWKCDRGYRATDDACVAITVPANGYFVDASYGRGWKCDRGFRAVGDVCVAIEEPENAHLDYSGNNWECDRPYRERQDKCVLPRTY
jgi:hypothetical protein